VGKAVGHGIRCQPTQEEQFPGVSHKSTAGLDPAGAAQAFQAVTNDDVTLTAISIPEIPELA
jgi:hypothetical protein